MQNGHIVIIMIGLIILFIIRLFYIRLGQKIHEYYKRQARRIYKKINKEGAFSNPAAILNYLRKINPYVFEELLLLAFEKKGYKVKHNKRYSGDGGMDGHIYVNKEWIPIQAKRYKSHIKRKHIKEFDNLLVKQNKPYGMFIHTGRTGRGSLDDEFSHVRFVSGNKLIDLLTGAKEID